MGKRSRHDETEEERKERRKAKKEAKKMKKEEEPNSEGGVASDKEIQIPASTPKKRPIQDLAPERKSEIVVHGRHAQGKTPFERKMLKMVVSLYPVALDDVLTHVRESLRSLLLKYSDGVGGVLLAFENVTLATDANGFDGHGFILNELPYIHYLVDIEALVFSPVVGKKLTGVVNECFPSHVGMLVHSYFNAMVSSDHMHSAGYVFDRDLQQWMQDDGAKVLGNDDKVDFVIEKMHECGGVISMEGSHPSICL